MAIATFRKVLVVDDETNMRHMLATLLAREGLEVESAASGEEALTLIRTGRFDLAVTDMRMPGMGGTELLKAVRAEGWPLPVIAMSAYGDDDAAVSAVRAGAYDFISKPFKSAEIMLLLRKAEEREQLRRENRTLRARLEGQLGEGRIIYASDAMKRVLEMVHKVAAHPTTVLVTGESGTGKELIARELHARSERKGEFVAVNCSAIPEHLLESELFGHARGAFTDAVRDKPGLFELANGGTLFLDEVGDMPVSIQVKLLRVLQEGEVRRVGEHRSQKFDVRVIAATLRDLAKSVGEGKFREDLFYRLSVVPIHLPPLRDRLVDLPLLVDRFVAVYNEKLRLNTEGVTPGAMRVLMRHPWPGNVRELENTIQRAMVLSQSAVLHEDAFENAFQRTRAITQEILDGDDLSVKRMTEKIERELIRRALTRTRGNRTRAAQLLDLSHRALLYKLKDYGIDDL